MVCNKCKNLAVKNHNNNYNMLQNEVNRVFDNFLDVFDFPIHTHQILEPKIEVIENDKDIQVTAELPGMDEKDIEIDISKDGYLTIRGEKKSSNEEKSKNHYFSERSYGMVERTISLPSEIDIDKVSASFKKGVLKIDAPKLNQLENRKKIEVKGE
ncbi:MAG: Hsp20/alpha crystallin family protein [Alphaproteobacteria bacterium]